MVNNTVDCREAVGSIHGIHQSSHHSYANIMRCKAKFYFWRAKIRKVQFCNTSAYLFTNKQCYCIFIFPSFKILIFLWLWLKGKRKENPSIDSNNSFLLSQKYALSSESMIVLIQTSLYRLKLP